MDNSLMQRESIQRKIADWIAQAGRSVLAPPIRARSPNSSMT